MRGSICGMASDVLSKAGQSMCFFPVVDRVFVDAVLPRSFGARHTAGSEEPQSEKEIP
jgi:hypothetical protein